MAEHIATFEKITKHLQQQIKLFTVESNKLMECFQNMKTMHDNIIAHHQSMFMFMISFFFFLNKLIYIYRLLSHCFCRSRFMQCVLLIAVIKKYSSKRICTSK